MTTITLNLYDKYARQLQRELGRSQGQMIVPAKAKFTFDSVEGHSKVTLQLIVEETPQ